MPAATHSTDATSAATSHAPHDLLSQFVRVFLDSNLSAILILFSVLIGGAAMLATPREEDPQIVVPLADVFVNFPGHSASEVEQLVSTSLERVLYQIDGVEYVYSMSRENQAIITVRFFVGQDRERSLVKLFKKLDENLDLVPSGVSGWVVKPVEIDDVPVVTLALTGADSHTLRRVGEETIERLAAIPDVSRAYVVGGEPRVLHVQLDAERLQAHRLSPAEVERAIRGANATLPAGEFTRHDKLLRIEAGSEIHSAQDVSALVVGVFDGHPVFLKDVATVTDGPGEVANYVRFGQGPASRSRVAPRHEVPIGNSRGVAAPNISRNALASGSNGSDRTGDESSGGEANRSDSTSGETERTEPDASAFRLIPSKPAVTLALAKKKGTNVVAVADEIIRKAEELRRDSLPDDIELTVTRNYGQTADEKVNELIEALAVAILIVVALLTLSLGWREALIVAVAVPVVFGLTLAVNLLFGYSINRVTLFALILSLGLLVDDPIVDVENITRHFEQQRRATREITLAAVAEIRPPLISATLAVIVSFLPLFFITGMMGPYMAPMALNVPVSMLMSMLVAFTITPWLSFHLLKSRFNKDVAVSVRETNAERSLNTHSAADLPKSGSHELYDPDEVKRSPLYRFFRPLMSPLLKTRPRALAFLGLMAALTVGAMGLAATRSVPLKMLPFDNKNELLLVLDFDEGTTLERTNAAVMEFEDLLATVPEVTDFTSYVGLNSPIDFNGLVRHYYLRQAPHLAEIRINLVGKKQRHSQSHAIGLRLRDELTSLAKHHAADLKIVELPPGPPVLASVVAEVYGRPDHSYADLLTAADSVADRFRQEPGLADIDSIREAAAEKLVFVSDQEKAALAGISVAEIAAAIRLGLGGADDQTVRVDRERHPLRIVIRMPRADRSSAADLARLQVKGLSGELVPLAELGRWESRRVDQTIYHKNLARVVYVFAETAGRPPAECIADVLADRAAESLHVAESFHDSDSAPSASNSRLINQRDNNINRKNLGHGSDRATPDRATPDRTTPRPLASRTYFRNGSGIPWSVPEGIRVDFAGEGEWKITIDVFRDLGLAFGAAMLMIYVILVAQTGSFLIPAIVMLAIPLTVLGVMPGFWLLNQLTAQTVGGYADPVYFTATAMIGMIALAGIVTRDSIILVDFIQLAMRHGRSLFDAILESRVVRLRPILLTAGAAMLSSLPITLDPIFSGLGWSLIFGLFASTVFTLFVIPISYWLIYAHRLEPSGKPHPDGTP